MITVGFYGKYIPLQGADVIVRAAALLKDSSDIRFVMLGTGQTYETVRTLARELKAENVTFLERIPYEELPALLDTFDIALGVFGETEKAARVIPNKVYEAAARAKPIITADTPAIRELFTDGSDLLLCRRNDPKDLAEKILFLAKDVALRERLGRGAEETFVQRASTKVIGRDLMAALGALAE